MASDFTPKAGLARVLPRQTQAHAPISENFGIIDTMLNPSVKDRDLSAPPGSPADGATYIVAGTGTGDWSGEDGNIAIFVDTEWLFVAPQDGMLIFIEDEDEWLGYNSTESEWHPMHKRWSTTEHWTGRYNGTASATNKIYAKVITLTTFPNSTTKNFAHSITNLDVTKPVTFQAYAEDGTTNYVVPTAVSAGHMGVGVDATNVAVFASFNAAGFDGAVRLEYQKTS